MAKRGGLKQTHHWQENEASRLEGLEQNLAEVATYLKACEETTDEAQKQRQADERELGRARAELIKREAESNTLKLTNRRKL